MRGSRNTKIEKLFKNARQLNTLGKGWKNANALLMN
jgi:hypothetical protein